MTIDAHERLMKCRAERGVVLVIEDDSEIREVMGEVLREEGFDVASAEDGQAALDWLRDHPPPCVILLDLYMPVMSGEEFRSAQLRDEAWAHVPVVVVSAARDVHKRAAALQAVGFVRKPVALDRLLSMVAAHC